MIYANINGIRSVAQKKKKGICPYCSGEVIPKCGTKVIHHWAHKSKDFICDYKSETNWHINWKLKF